MFFSSLRKAADLVFSAPVYERLHFMLQLLKINVASEVKHAWNAFSLFLSS